MLPHLLPYIFSQFSMVLGFGGLQRVTTRYRQFSFKKVLIYIFLITLTVTSGNPLQIAPKLCQTERKCTITCVVTRWSYDKVLHYGLSILNWEKMCTVMRSSYGNALCYGLLSMSVECEKLPDPFVIRISVRLSKPFHLLQSVRSSLNSASTNVQI